MTGNHTPEVIAILNQTRRRLKPIVERGAATCWRCGQPIERGEAWDVGHRQDLAHGGDIRDVAPEHRHRTPYCRGNRSAGGTVGARKTNALKQARKRRDSTDPRLPNW